MSEPKAFMKAIRRNPSDNLPRLVYADWLEERGETEYAEFIRLAVAKQGELCIELHPTYRRLVEYGISLYYPVSIDQQDRGFISSITILDSPRRYLKTYRNCCLNEIRQIWKCIITPRGGAMNTGEPYRLSIDDIPYDLPTADDVIEIATIDGGWSIAGGVATPNTAKNSWGKCQKLISDACILSLKRLADELE